MYKVVTIITNTVNDNEDIDVSVAMTYARAEAIVAKAEAEVVEWNKPEPSGSYGGKMSMRYLESEIEEIDEDTGLAGLTVGMLLQIINEATGE